MDHLTITAWRGIHTRATPPHLREGPVFATYGTDIIGGEQWTVLCLFNTPAESIDGATWEAWTSDRHNLPVNPTPDQATAFLRGQHWRVQGGWTYDQANDRFTATAYQHL